MSTQDNQCWRKVWMIWAICYAVSMVPLLAAGDWMAAWFCGCTILYCVIGRQREDARS